MSITKADVADLREGDVVELGFSSGAIVRGPLVEDRHAGGLDIADAGWSVRQRDGELSYGIERMVETLTVVSRAPRPLYVNHDRTEPVAGDVVRDADSEAGTVWAFVHRNDENRQLPWQNLKAVEGDITRGCFRRELPTRLHLLVDGETGQVVQP